VDIKEVYKICDFVLDNLKKTKTTVAPCSLDLKTRSNIHNEAIDILLDNNLIVFIGGERGFDKHFRITHKGLSVKNGVEKFLQPKPFWKKIEFVIPTIISLFALITPFVIRYLDEKEEVNVSTKYKEIQVKVDRVSEKVEKTNDRNENLEKVTLRK
jgi:hypothetical protein